MFCLGLDLETGLPGKRKGIALTRNPGKRLGALERITVLGDVNLSWGVLELPSALWIQSFSL